MPASKCGTCNKNVTKSDSGVRCNYCRIWFHSICADISDELYKILGEKNGSLVYTCANCLKNPRESPSNASSSEMRQCIEELDKKISANFSAFTAELRTEQRDLKDMIGSSISDIRADLSSSLKELQANIADCNNAIKHVETNTLEQISNLELENNRLHRRVNRADIVITGLPSGINNLFEPILSIFSHYKINADAKDINHCIYIQQGRSLLVKFNNVHLRDDLMKAYFKTRSLMLSDVIGTQVAARVYLNDHLTPACNKLQTICRTLRKEGKIAWFRILNGDVPLVKIKFSDGSTKQCDFLQCCELRDVGH